jgi:hypothetical protein
VRCTKLTNSNGTGLKVSRNTALKASVYGFSINVLSNSFILMNWKKSTDIWNIDFRKRGLRGNSCRPQPMEKYLLKPLSVEFTLTFEATK